MNLKLGKLPPKIDRRTIPLKSIIRALPPIPEKWDVDAQFNFSLPKSMFGNDRLGDCVIAGRANLTLRFEAYEQKKAIAISDSDVTKEYFKESGGEDNGLVMLDSLNAWRKNGWLIGARKIACLKIKGQTYNIHAFAKLGQGNAEELRTCVYLLGGCYGGFNLPQSAMDAFDNGQTWDDVGDTNIAGGHCMTMKSYNEIGPKALTWAKEIQMTWRFYKKYADESYGVVDDRDRFEIDSPVDVEKLEQLLMEVTG